MLTQPVAVPDARVRAALEDGWGVRCASLAYLPLGAGGHHWRAVGESGAAWFVTVDDGRTKPWLGDDPAVASQRLDAALRVPLLLRERDGLDVVAPVPSRSGQATVRLDGAFVVSVSTWVDGAAGAFATAWDGDGRDDVLGVLARMHAVEPPSGLHVAALLPERASLRAALDSTASAWTGGPHAEPARAWLVAHADDVAARLRDLEALETSWGARPRVVTHGEPHPGNVLVSDGRRLLVDWDTAALAPPERDLWWFGDDDLSTWTARTGMDVDTALLAAYRLAWTLADVASFVTELRGPHEDTDDTRAALRWLTSQDVTASILG